MKLRVRVGETLPVKIGGRTARKSLPPDPDLNAPWSPCIAILDEAAPPKED